MSLEISDRDKLASAFDELRSKGYYTDISMAWKTCCSSCGHHEIEDQYKTGNCKNRNKYVFWHSGADDSSFYEEGYEMPESAWQEAFDHFEGDIDNEDEVQEYLDEFFMKFVETPEFESMDIEERLTNRNRIMETLYLQWAGNPHEIVEVLTKNGLKTALPYTGDSALPVFPDDAELIV